MLNYILFILACICKPFFAYPPETTSSDYDSSDLLISVKPAISHYFDDTASSALLVQMPLAIPNQEKKKSPVRKVRKSTYIFTPSHRAKMAASWTKERREKQSQISRNRILGNPHSTERKLKLSQALLGRLVKQGTREKLRQAQLGKEKSEATKQKISESVKRARRRKKEMLQNLQKTQPKD